VVPIRTNHKNGVRWSIIKTTHHWRASEYHTVSNVKNYWHFSETCCLFLLDQIQPWKKEKTGIWIIDKLFWHSEISIRFSYRSPNKLPLSKTKYKRLIKCGCHTTLSTSLQQLQFIYLAPHLYQKYCTNLSHAVVANASVFLASMHLIQWQTPILRQPVFFPLGVDHQQTRNTA
jgi:hypothetical protein